MRELLTSAEAAQAGAEAAAKAWEEKALLLEGQLQVIVCMNGKFRH